MRSPPCIHSGNHRLHLKNAVFIQKIAVCIHEIDGSSTRGAVGKRGGRAQRAELAREGGGVYGEGVEREEGGVIASEDGELVAEFRLPSPPTGALPTVPVYPGVELGTGDACGRGTSLGGVPRQHKILNGNLP